ncbi:MAG: prepilin-type N-terminal cleavage/methylation domain-containing protein [Planctomycetota bacterium]
MRHAFSLIELVIVVVLVTIIAAVAAPAFSSISSRSKYNAAHAGFQSIDRAAQMYQLDFGGLPPNTPINVQPPELVGYLQHDVFTKHPPIGRAWDWNGPGSGITKYGYNISIHTTTTADQDAIEEAFDDGSYTTGIYRRHNHYLMYPVTEH